MNNYCYANKITGFYIKITSLASLLQKLPFYLGKFHSKY